MAAKKTNQELSAEVSKLRGELTLSWSACAQLRATIVELRGRIGELLDDAPGATMPQERPSPGYVSDDPK